MLVTLNQQLELTHHAGSDLERELSLTKTIPFLTISSFLGDAINSCFIAPSVSPPLKTAATIDNFWRGN